MTTTKTTPRYLCLHNEVWQKVEKYAREQNRPLSNMLEQIVVEWIRAREEEDVTGQIQKGTERKSELRETLKGE